MRIATLALGARYLNARLLVASLLTYPAIAQVGHPTAAVPDAPPQLTYTLAMPAPSTHYFAVTLTMAADSAAYTDLKMPVWTPGSYLVREFERHVERVQARGAAGQPLAVEKMTKNTWRVRHAPRTGLVVTYQVYANESSVRTSYLDADHAFVAGNATFLYPAAHPDWASELTVQPAPGWTSVSTALRPVAGRATPYVYQAGNYDELVDSPLEIGTHRVLRFVTANTPHEVALAGPYELPDEAKFLADLQRVTGEAQRVVGQNPLDRYTFLIEHNRVGSGGLEHRNCVAIGLPAHPYAGEQAYLGFLQLVAHEYFHLWNVKRIRPVALGPFDYDQENYTRLLWLSEGQTDYMGSLLLERAGYYSPQAYFDHLARLITRVESQPGNQAQSVAEASFDAWIGYYRSDENSANTQSDYYQKGELIGLLLDLMLVEATNGRKHLDDVFRLLYARYYQGLQRGFTDQEYQDAVAEVAGRRFDDFFQQGVYGTRPLDYATALGYAGLTLSSVPTTTAGSLGATVRVRDGHYLVTDVRPEGAAWRGGLNVDDELLQLNGAPLTAEAWAHVQQAAPGTALALQVQHGLRTHELHLTLLADPTRTYQLRPLARPTPAQLLRRRKWLSSPAP